VYLLFQWWSFADSSGPTSLGVRRILSLALGNTSYNERYKGDLMSKLDLARVAMSATVLALLEFHEGGGSFRVEVSGSTCDPKEFLFSAVGEVASKTWNDVVRVVLEPENNQGHVRTELTRSGCLPRRKFTYNERGEVTLPPVTP
jgi:hypothetical protein